MKKILLFFILLIIIITGSGMIWWNINISPADKTNTAQQIFVIGQGSTVRGIGNDLEQAGLIKNATAFYMWVKLHNLDNKIQSGDFRLSPSQPLETIASNLTKGSLDYWLRIPEGLRADEIAEKLKQLSPNYTDSWKTQLEANEGYLFPDSYLIPMGDNATDIIAILRKNFDEKYATIGSSKYSQKEIVIVASLLQREVPDASDQAMVASVIYNRLDIGMAVQVDPSVQYAIGYYPPQKSWWKKGLTANDLKINSPYNTYMNPGLPPTPISNPGLSALQAAAHPKESDYLYYLSDSAGNLHFSKTFAEHNANIQKYNVQ